MCTNINSKLLYKIFMCNGRKNGAKSEATNSEGCFVFILSICSTV